MRCWLILLMLVVGCNPAFPELKITQIEVKEYFEKYPTLYHRHWIPYLASQDFDPGVHGELNEMGRYIRKCNSKYCIGVFKDGCQMRAKNEKGGERFWVIYNHPPENLEAPYVFWSEGKVKQ